MAFDQTGVKPEPEPELEPETGPDFLQDLNKTFGEGVLTTALREDLEALANFSDADLESKGLTRSRVERAIRRKHIQTLYG